MIKMEWETAKVIEFYMIGHKTSPRRPDTILKDVKYKFINSGLLYSEGKEGKIDFVPNQRIQQVTITP